VSSNLAVAAVDAAHAVHERLAAAGSPGVDEVCVRGRRPRLDMIGMLDGTLRGFEIKADNDDLHDYAIKRARRDRASEDWSWSLASATSPRRSSKCRDGGASGWRALLRIVPPVLY
jgi:hypothetical protein